MHKRIALTLVIVFLSQSIALAGLGNKKAAYAGGTIAGFKDAKKPPEGELKTDDEKSLMFLYKDASKQEKTIAIPYDQIIDIEYGQKAGRRVGAAIATAILISPIGLFLLFSKKRKHFITIGFKDQDGKDQVAVFELGKDIVRNTLAIVKTRSGKEITYQDDEARKSGKGN